MSGTFTPDQEPSGVFTPDPPPSWGETFAAIPEITKGGLQQGLGGLTQMLGDVTNKIWGDESVTRVGKGIAESGKINTDLGTPANMTFPQQAVAQGGASVLTSATLLPMGPVAGTVGLGVLTAGQTYDEAKGAGLSAGRSFGHALFEGTVETLTEYLPAKALFGQHKNILAKAIDVLSKEYPGEVLATVLQDASAKVGYRPDMTAKEFLDDILLTLGATTVAAPAMALGAGAVQRIARRPTPTPENDPNLKTKPVYPNAGVEAQETVIGTDTTQGTELFGPPKPEGYVYPKTSTSDGTAFTPENYAKMYYDRVKAQVDLGEPVSGMDRMWMKWYEEGTVTERPFASELPADPVEEASKRLENAAAQRDVGTTLSSQPASDTGGIILPNMGGPKVDTSTPAPAPEPSGVVDPANQPVGTVAGPETKADVTDAPGPRVAELKGGNLPGSVVDVTEDKPKSAGQIDYERSPKVVADTVTVVKNGPDSYSWHAELASPRGTAMMNISGGESADSLHAAVGQALAEKLMADASKSGTAKAHDVDLSTIRMSSRDIAAVQKVHQIRAARDQYGRSIPGKLTRVSSVSNIVNIFPTGTDTYAKQIADEATSGQTLGETRGPDPGRVMLLTDNGQSSPGDKRLKTILQKWVSKYVPQANVVLVRGTKPSFAGNGNPAGAMIPSEDGVYYIYVEDKNPAHTQMMVLAHEFGHLLIVDQFYKSSASEQAALFKEYHEFLDAVQQNQLTPDQYQAQRFGPEAFMHGMLPSKAFKSGKSIDTQVLAMDATTFKGYTLSFDEFYAQQFVKFALAEGEFNATPETTSVMTRALEKVKEFFADFGKYFAPGKAFKTWVKGLAGETESVKPELSAQEKKMQAKLSAMLKRAGMTPEDIDALRNDDGLLDEDQVYEVVGEPVSRTKKAPKDLDFTSLEELWPGDGKNIPSMVQPLAKVEPEIGNSLTRFNWFISKMASLLQITKLNAHVPGVQEFTNGMRRMFATKATWTGAADTRIKAWRELGKEQSDKLTKLLLEEARNGKFVGSIVQNGTSSREQTYQLDYEEAQRRGLNDAATSLYAEIHGDYLRALNAMELRAVEELWRVYAPEDYYNYVRGGGTSEGLLMLGPTHPLLAQHIANTQKSFSGLREAPYLPFTRFGRNAVLVKATAPMTWQGKDYKAGETLYFSAFETVKERNEDLAKLRKDMEFLPATVSGVYIKDEEYNMRGLPPALANALKVRLQLDEKQANDLNDILTSMTSSQAFVRHLQKRKGVAGYSEDVMRVYGDYFLRFSNYIARLEHGHELDRAMDEVAKSARAITDAGGISDKRDQLHEWLFRMRDYVMKPQNELEDVRGALTVSYLMFNVKSAMVNGFQVPFVTVPYLSSRYSWGKAFAQTQKAYKDVLSSWTDPKKLSDAEWEALQRGLRDGFLDESFASALANTAEGSNLLRALPSGRIGKGWEWVKHNGMLMFQKMEEMNRRVTFMAAYRLAKDAGKADALAYNEARSAIEDTQNEYAKWNRPEFMRGPIKSLMFMFMQYQQNMIFQMYGGDKSWARLLGTHLALAGLMGLPFMGNLKDLVKWFGKLFDENWDLEMEAREFVADVGLNPDWMMNGTMHNFFGVDLSGSLSMGRPIPATEALAAEGRFAEKTLSASQDLGGAGIGYLLNVMQAIADDNPNTFMRVQRAMPTFLQNAMKGIDEFEQGGKVDRSGALISEVSGTEAVLHGVLGFNPAQAAAESREFHAKKQLAEFWLTRRSVLMAQYFYAKEVAKDREATADVREAIRDFNVSAPDRKLAISTADLARSVQSRLRVRRANAQGLPLGKKVEGLVGRVEQLYQTDQ